jgi:hypothetical protein
MSRTVSVKQMTFYQDLSEYTYHRAHSRPGMRNVGWLGLGHEFNQAAPTEEILDRIWDFCKISVAQMRGIHQCEFCEDDSYYAERNGESLLLGSSEIRVFSSSGQIYAAPNLIYHYLKRHHYKPPDEFIDAILGGPVSPRKEYLDRLRDFDIQWNWTSAPTQKPLRFRFAPLD